MEVSNSVPDSQTAGQSQPIKETDDVPEMIGAPAPDVIGDVGVEAELGADLVKKKRGRPPRGQVKSPPVKIVKEEDEDVCFICFDGGSLVLCDRRGCPKAYHPACVKRDDAFFQSKAKWTCGWHICSFCQKAAHHMCYTCTYSLCKGCIKKADYVCVRGDKGFCIVCLKTIMLIENEGQEKDEKAQVDFDDKTSWEYLFKVYWVYLKRKLSLTLDELTEAKNPWKLNSTTTSVSPSKCVHKESNDLKSITSTTTSVSPSTCVDNGSNDLKSITSDMSPQNLEASENKRRKTEEHISIPQNETVIAKKTGTEKRSSMVACKNWATKELLDFVAYMKKGNRSMLSQYEVQELMLEYIKINNLRDPRKKSQIICDSRLNILFGKPRVGHFEMLKLLEFHFFIKEDLPKNTVTSISRQVDPDWNIDNMVTVGKDKKRRNHKKVEERAPQNKVDEYAAINVHNMNLVYLRRKLVENFIENKEEFGKKVIGSIVRIRISGNDQKHDMYRLVQVVGTSKVDVPYKIGNKSADVVLEVLNLDKKETISADKISNQDLSEDECRRLRQSIRCGLVKRFTVGEIQDKAVSLQSVRLNDLMEAETLRLNNLRDRASEKGHKKSLREYVEKLQLLKTPEERERRLREIPEVHSDPKMNPDYETDDTEEYFNKEHGEPTKLKYSGISRKNTISPKKQADVSNNVGSRKWKKDEGSPKALGKLNIKRDAHRSSNGSTNINFNHKTTGSSSLLNTASETSTASNSTKNFPLPNYSDIDKVWYYRDPIGKVQGPFCMVQLQKWSTTGYFPPDMRIWTHNENESLLLNDVLKEQLHNKTATEKVGVRIEGLTVQTSNLSSTQNSVNHVKLSDSHGSTGQSSVQNWFVNGNKLNHNKSNVSNMPDMASPTPAGNNADIKNVSSVYDIANADLVDLPSPTPKKTIHEVAKVSTAVDKEQEVGVAQLPETADEWSGYSPTQVEHKKTAHEDENVRNAVDKGQDAGRALLPKTADEWSGYSPTRVKETTTHETVKVQTAVDKEQDASGALLPKTDDEWSGYSPTRVKETATHEVAKVQTAVGNEQDIGGALLPKTDDEWSGYSPKVKETATHEVAKVQTAVGNEQDIGGALLPRKADEWSGYSPTQVEETTLEVAKGQTVVDKEQDVGEAQLPKTAVEWNGYSPTQVKREELHCEGDSVATTTTNIEQVIPSSTQAKREEWHSADDHVATPIANIEQVISSSIQAKQDEWHSEGDHVATTTTSINIIIPLSSQPVYNSYLPPWEGVHETIEFSTLAEESVSDLLAEVDAMESQNGFPSPTSRRNNFVEDLFNGAFEDFSPTPQGARGGPFSSNGAEIELSFQPTTTTTITTTTTTTTIAATSQGNSSNVFDFVKSSTDLQFKWPEIPQETSSKDTIDVNSSTKTEADEGERETKIGCDQIEEKAVPMCSDQNASETSHDLEGGSNEHKADECTKPVTTELKDPSPELVLQMSRSMEPKGTDQIQAAGSPPSPPLSLTIGLDKIHPQQSIMNNLGRPAQEITTGVDPHSNMANMNNLGRPAQEITTPVDPHSNMANMNHLGRPAQEITTRVDPHSNMARAVNLVWDPHQRTFVGERYNNNSMRERSYNVEESGYSRNGKPWVRQSSFGSGSGGGFSRTPPKGQRVCKFYESGRCRKGASCNYWHP